MRRLDRAWKEYLKATKGAAADLERMARAPNDPVAPLAASQLFHVNPQFPTEPIEDIVITQGKPAGDLLFWLCARPKERMIPHLRQFLDEGRAVQGTVRYLESQGTISRNPVQVNR